MLNTFCLVRMYRYPTKPNFKVLENLALTFHTLNKLRGIFPILKFEGAVA